MGDLGSPRTETDSGDRQRLEFCTENHRFLQYLNAGYSPKDPVDELSKVRPERFSNVATANPSQVRRAASPHLPLTLDDDASPHEGMYLAEVPLLPSTFEGVCIPLSFTQTS